MTEENVQTGITDTELDRGAIVEEFKQLKGVGGARAEKFIDAGFCSLSAIAIADVRDFCDRTGLPKSSAEQVINNARGLIGMGEFETLDQIAEDETHAEYLSTGSLAVDELLCGGIPTGKITEVFAENGVGKTQFCMTEAVIATLPKDKGGFDSHVLYVDAENTFSAKRTLEIAKARGCDIKDVASKIHCVRTNNSAHQILLMDKINEEAVKYPVKLLIIDSVIAHFRAEYIGRGSLSERQQQLGHYLSQLRNFAIANDAVVLVTNQMMANPDGMMFAGNLATGGNVLGHNCPIQIQIRRGQQGKRIIKLAKSNELPNGETVCRITDKGLEDIPVKD